MLRKSSVDTVKPFGGIRLKKIAAPACSRLYSLEPVGVATAMVESLTSYTSRLAVAHCVSVGVLVGREIAPLINKSYLTEKIAGTMAFQIRDAARAMNGIGITATDWVGALQDLTCRQELRFLTMLPLKDLFSIQKLLRKSRAWCPECYECWKQIGTPIYEPLQWALEVVTVCPAHRRILNTSCPHCKRRIPVLPRLSVPGICSNCKQWLGISTLSRPVGKDLLVDPQMEWQSWVVLQLGSILSALPELKLQINKAVFTNLVNLCLQRLTKGRSQLFSQRVKSFSPSTLEAWLQGNTGPQIGKIMRLCYEAGVPFAEFLLFGQVREERSSVLVFTQLRESPALTDEDAIRMKMSLQEMLNEDPPPSIFEAADRLGCHYLTVKKYQPELYNLIREKHSKSRAERFNKRRIGSAISLAKEETPPPSLSSLARRLGCSRAFLTQSFREDSSIIAQRHAEYRRVFSDVTQTLIVLKELQKIYPPLSIIQCTEHLKCTRDQLYKYFPEITRAIGIRYKKYCKRKAERRRKERRERILKTAAIIETEGIIPTSYLIRKRLPKISGLFNREIDAVLSGESK